MVIEDYNIYSPSRDEKLKIQAIGFVIISAILYLFFKSRFAFLMAIPINRLSVLLYADYKAKERKKLFINQFRDLLYSLSASIASGRHMSEALIDARDNLALLYPDDSPMITELDYARFKMNSANESVDAILSDMGLRSGIRDVITFADIYSVAVTTGADLIKVIGTTSQIIIDKLTIKRDMESYVAQKKFEGRVIAALSPIMILFLNIVSPGYLDPLYSSVNGRLIMAISLILTTAGFIMADKIMDVKLWDDKSNKKLFYKQKRNKA